MHKRDEFPEIWAAMEKAREELAPLMKEREKHMAAMQKVQDEIVALREKKNACHDKACSNLARIRELHSTIARMANAMGAVKV